MLGNAYLFLPAMCIYHLKYYHKRGVQEGVPRDLESSSPEALGRETVTLVTEQQREGSPGWVPVNGT